MSSTDDVAAEAARPRVNWRSGQCPVNPLLPSTLRPTWWERCPLSHALQSSPREQFPLGLRPAWCHSVSLRARQQSCQPMRGLPSAAPLAGGSFSLTDHGQSVLWNLNVRRPRGNLETNLLGELGARAGGPIRVVAKDSPMRSGRQPRSSVASCLLCAQSATDGLDVPGVSRAQAVSRHEDRLLRHSLSREEQARDLEPSGSGGVPRHKCAQGLALPASSTSAR